MSVGLHADTEIHRWQEEMAQPDADQWNKVVKEDMEMLNEQGVWKLVDVPRAQPVRYFIWVLCKKYRKGV